MIIKCSILSCPVNIQYCDRKIRVWIFRCNRTSQRFKHSCGGKQGNFGKIRARAALNSLNGDVYEECRVVLENAEIAGAMDISGIPLLMFTTNYGGGKNSAAWVAAQEDFASKIKECTQIKYKCGHNLHYHKSGEMADSIKSFLKNYESY